MKNNTKIKPAALAVIITFLGIIFAGMILHFAMPDREVSNDERRYLASFPEITLEKTLDSKFSGEFDTYMTDQFPFRSLFRKLKALCGFVTGSADNNGYIKDGNDIYKLDKKTDTKQIAYAASHFDSIAKQYLSGYDVYYTIIPDKNYYTDKFFPKLDYELLWKTMEENNTLAKYIGITDTLTADCYYDTDTHWKQEMIIPTSERLLEGMGMEITPVEFEERVIGTFPGVYKAHSGYSAYDDTLTVLSNSYIENAVVHNLETGKDEPVYQTDLLNSMDGYDVYLGGASALLVIENPDAQTDRELVIFRDSFGSSLVPLFIPYYSKISVIDIRYVSNTILGDYIDFSGEGDALFAYSTILLNSGRVLR